MAASTTPDINSIVYSYLLNHCPQSAKTFAKTAKVKSVQPGTPSLEDIIKKSGPVAASPSAKLQKGLQTNKNVDTSDSSDDSSDSEKGQLAQPQITLKNTGTAVSKTLYKGQNAKKKAHHPLIVQLLKKRVLRQLVESSPTYKYWFKKKMEPSHNKGGGKYKTT
ncbi:hypothetical protein NPIL_622551 [Nephila pilipes]|uniref:LisH domain-containing protein n=1 Tax=Nephila pilipes TaxID=299642 RepID=A0A8X6PF76_NEPPI|nr:hypothetical protein NPIL_622551 [Nephila pilipes]